jgi:hypothetical protein
MMMTIVPAAVRVAVVPVGASTVRRQGCRRRRGDCKISDNRLRVSQEDRFQGASESATPRHSHVSHLVVFCRLPVAVCRRETVTLPLVAIPLPTRRSASMSITIPPPAVAMAHPPSDGRLLSGTYY